jgi:hypothetical protein
MAVNQVNSEDSLCVMASEQGSEIHNMVFCNRRLLGIVQKFVVSKEC